MCLLCCGRTLAAYAVDNDIVGMNGAHRPPPCMYSGAQHQCTVHTGYTANCTGCAWSKLVSIYHYYNRYGGKCIVQKHVV